MPTIDSTQLPLLTHPSDRLVFGIDYDRTYTRDPLVFDALIQCLKLRGHRVFIVTQRTGSDERQGSSVAKENREECKVPHCNTIFTDGAPKEWHMLRKLGIKVDIWIDDDPKSVIEKKTWR